MILRNFHIKRYRDLAVFPALLIVVASIYLSGCSSARQYKVLSFFFDGVPNPAEQTLIQKPDSVAKKDSIASANALAAEALPKGSIHPPYKDKDCASCHDQTSMGKFTEVQPTLCYQCHDDFSTKYKELHGPVGGGQCTACHSPHLSENASLLKRTSQSLCLYCHDQKQVLAYEPHQDIGNTSCLECHNPHGGDDKFILR